MVEYIGRHNLEIVVRGVREGAFAIAVPERPYAGRACSQLIVHRDVPALVRLNTSLFESQIVGVGPASYREQHMRSHRFAILILAIETGDHILATLAEMDAFRVEPDVNSFALEDVLNSSRHVLVLVLHEPWSLFHDRDLATEAAEHLPEFEADVAAPDDQQSPGQKIHLHHRAVGEIGNLIDPRQGWDQGASTHVDEDTLRRKFLRANHDLMSGFEARVSLIYRAVVHALEPGFDV